MKNINMIKNSRPTAKFKLRGFSLVEILVGLIIGLLATMVIMSVFADFEGQRRTTAGSSDTQTNGSIALFNLQRDIQMAGFGIPMPMADPQDSSLKCNPLPEFDPDGNAATDNEIGFFPIEIIDAGDDTSDIIKVRYSMSAAGAIPVRRLGGPYTAYVLENNLGCSVGDVALVSNGAACFMTLVESVSADNATLGVDPEPPAAPTKVACMGDWQEYAYRIDNNQLIRQVRKPDELADEAIVDNVVALQAQYGVSASADSNRVIEWQNAVGLWSSASLDADVTLRNRIKAVRIAVVARSGLREKAEVTQECETFQGIDNNGPCAWDDQGYQAAPKIDLAPLYAEADEWKHYRYRSFETIIPLRNMLWSKGAL